MLDGGGTPAAPLAAAARRLSRLPSLPAMVKPPGLPVRCALGGAGSPDAALPAPPAPPSARRERVQEQSTVRWSAEGDMRFMQPKRGPATQAAAPRL